MRLRPAALLLAGVLAAVPARAEDPVKNPDTYTYLTISDANTFDPAYAFDVVSGAVIGNCYETLFAFDGGSTEALVPLLAEKVPSKANGLISRDGRTYTIPIRKGVRFQDGTPMTAEDVRYSFIRSMLQDRADGPAFILLEPLLGYRSTRDAKGTMNPDAYKDAVRAVQVKGDDLVLTLPTPYAPLLAVLAGRPSIVSKAWAVKNGDWDGSEATWRNYNDPKKETSPFFEKSNGTGPFLVERWDRKTMDIYLVRNDRYWKKPARLKRVIIKKVSEFATRKLMLLAGDADSISTDRPFLSQLQGLPGVRIIDDLPRLAISPILFFSFAINPVANPNIGSGKLDGAGIPVDFFADRDVRKAFAYSFDYQAFLKDVMGGRGGQATGCIPKGLLGHDPDLPTYRLDLEQAKAHFKKAWGGRVWEKGFKFTLAYNTGNAPRQALCQILKRNIESLNPKFQIEVRAIEWPTFLDQNSAHKLPAAAMGWNVDYPDPDDFAFPLMHSEGSHSKAQGYKNPEADALVEQARAEIDPAKRRELYSRLQRIEFEDVPHLVLVDNIAFRAARTWVQGWQFNPMDPDTPGGGLFYPLYKEAK